MPINDTKCVYQWKHLIQIANILPGLTRTVSGLILGLYPANERRSYFVFVIYLQYHSCFIFPMYNSLIKLLDLDNGVLRNRRTWPRRPFDIIFKVLTQAMFECGQCLVIFYPSSPGLRYVQDLIHSITVPETSSKFSANYQAAIFC